jgi:hypothetical protein
MADKVVEANRGVAETEEKPDEFEGAFDEATGKGEQADLTAADDPANVKDEEPEVKESPDTKPVVAEDKPIEEKPVEVDPEEKAEQRYKTLQGIHKHDKKAWDEEKTALLAQIEEAKKPKTPDKTPEQKKEDTIAAEAFVDSLTEEQKKQLEDYEADFDVVSKMEGLKRTRELAKLRKEMTDWKAEVKAEMEATIAAKSSEVDSKIAPAVKLAEENEREAHFSLIREGYTKEDGTVVSGHNDFKQYVDDGSLKEWIESKPSYLQTAMKRTYESGAAQDVIDLLADFKRESNIQSNLPSDNVVNLDAKKAARKAALTSVPSRRGAINTGKAVADDFEGAFDEAMNKAGG